LLSGPGGLTAESAAGHHKEQDGKNTRRIISDYSRPLHTISGLQLVKIQFSLAGYTD
jgi:hypothetical protein